MPARSLTPGRAATPAAVPAAALVTALAATLASAPAQAELGYLEPRASLYTFYDDNVGLNRTNAESSPGYILRVSARAGSRTETRDLNLDAEVTRRQYFSDSDRDTTDLGLNGQYLQRIERDRFELGLGLDWDSTLTSEVATSGRVQVRKRRERWSLAPGWERQVSERLSLNAGLSYQDVSYDDGLAAGLVDYSFATLGAGFGYGLDERTQLIGRVSYDRYDADQVRNEVESYGVLGGVAWAVSETWNLTTLLGVRRAEARTAAGREDSTGGLFDIASTWRLETGSLRAGLSKSLTPSGAGGLLDTTRANLRWNHDFDRRLGAVLDLDAYRNREPSGNAGADDRDYYAVAPRLRYRLERDWALELGYRYRYQKYDNQPDGADSNAVFVNIAYTPQRERPELDLTRR